MPTGLSNAERSARTQRALLDAARELFATQGYAATSNEAVVRRAGVTRGALYHHFSDRAALFRAVYEEQRVALLDAITARTQDTAGDLWQRVVVAACHEFLDRAANPRVRRILYVDGPAVLGQSTIQHSALGLERIRQEVAPLIAAGLLDPLPLAPLLHLFWANCFEAGSYVAYAADPRQAQDEMLPTLLRVFDGLRPRG